MGKGAIFSIFVGILGQIHGCVYITKSSNPPNKIEVNWNCEEQIRYIQLYDQDPDSHPNTVPLINFSVSERAERYFKTNITFSPEPFPGGWSRKERGNRVPESHCIYWTVTHFHEKKPLLDCFKIRPSWMAEYRSNISGLSLHSMFIPGTHDSGSGPAETISGIEKNRDSSFDAQDQSIWNQLVYGIRFFDFKITHKADEKEHRFWVSNDFNVVQPLIYVLREIVEFLRYSPDEVLVLDFHKDSKMQPDLFQQLSHIITKELRQMIFERPDDPSKMKMKDIWDSDKRIIVTYSRGFAEGNSWFWDNVAERWAKHHTAAELESFMQKTFKEFHPKRMWAIMACVTPKIGKKRGARRDLADPVNHLLSNWFYDRPQWLKKANIVATDFFLGNNLVDQAIEQNIKRGWRISCG